MSEKYIGPKIDLSGAVLFLGIFVLIILFWGEPDLHDAFIHRLMGPAVQDTAVAQPEIK